MEGWEDGKGKASGPVRLPSSVLSLQHLSQQITHPKSGPVIRAMVFPVVIYRCESQIIKKAERPRIDAFELWCWRRLSRVPQTARRSNQPIRKEINPEYSLEGLMLKVGTSKESISWKRSWSWERLKAGEEGSDREWDSWMASRTQWTWVWVNSREIA